MKLFKTLLFMMSIFFSSILMAQKPIKQIDFAYGAVYNLDLDWTYSRLAKRGFNQNINLGYFKQNNDKIFSIQATYITGSLGTKGNDVNKLTNLVTDFLVNYLIKIDRFSNDKNTVFGGISGDFRSNIWFPQFSRLRYGWDIHTGIGASIFTRHTISTKIAIEYEMDLPLIGVLWRSHNNGQQLVTEEVQLEKGTAASAFEIPRFSHVFNTIYFDNSFKMNYDLAARFVLYYNFGVSYKYINKPLVKKGFKFINLLGIKYKL